MRQKLAVSPLASFLNFFGYSIANRIDVNGVGNAEVVAGVCNVFGFHNLSVEDVVRVSQRPKVED